MKNVGYVIGAFLGLLLVIAIGFAISSALKVGNTAVDRVVLEQSHQYKHGMKERVAMFEASLTEINARLSGQLDPQTRANLETQRATLNAQLRAARSVQ